MTDRNYFQFDLEGLKAILIGAGLDPAQQHDMRLFTSELGEPGTNFADAAKRASAKKARAAQGSGFDQLNSYFRAFSPSLHSDKPIQSGRERSEPTDLQMLRKAFRDFKAKGR